MRKLLLILLLSSLGVLALASPPTWILSVNDTFQRANTNISPPAGQNSGVGNAWIDSNGGVGHIAGDACTVTCDTTNGSQYNRDTILRPSAENQVNQQIVIQIPAQASGTNLAYFAYTRWQSAGNGFIAVWNLTSLNTLKIFKNVSGTPTQVGSTTNTTTYNNAHAYTLTFYVYNNAGVPTLYADIYDVTATSDIGSASTTASGVYTGSGGMAFGVMNSAGTSSAVTGTVSQVETYTDSTLTMTPYTPTVVPSETGVVASVTWYGGTGPFNVKWYRGTVPNFTPG